jgi:ABC-2 type transport system permease protein
VTGGLRAMGAVARAELSGLVHTPLGGLVLAALWGASGLLWVVGVARWQAVAADRVLSPYAAWEASPMDGLVGPWLGQVAVVLLVVAPGLAMRGFADEARQGALDGLLSAPLTPAQVVVGKLLGLVGFLGVGVLATAWLPLTLGADLDLGALASAYVTLVGLTAVLAALGLAASAHTDRQGVALLVAFALSLSLWILGPLAGDPGSPLGQLALSTHVRDGLRGLLRLSDLSYGALAVGWCGLAAGLGFSLARR